MKLERISDNQIRCTLTANDLAQRSLKLSELAYGSEKAKALFHDLMDQASTELGFDTDGMPLLIEAVPLNQDCIMLLITKVSEPEELDTRFSRFTDAKDSSDEEDSIGDETHSIDVDIMDIFKHLSDEISEKIKTGKLPIPKNSLGSQGNTKPEAGKKETPAAEADDSIENAAEPAEPTIRTRTFRFRSLDGAGNFCKAISEDTACKSILYKNPESGDFYLVITEEADKSMEFEATCKIASEYGAVHRMSRNNLYYFNEHYSKIIKQDAIRVLNRL